MSTEHDLTLARLDAAILRAEAAGHHETAAEWRRERERVANAGKTQWFTVTVTSATAGMFTGGLGYIGRSGPDYPIVRKPGGTVFEWPDAVTPPEDDGA